MDSNIRMASLVICDVGVEMKGLGVVLGEPRYKKRKNILTITGQRRQKKEEYQVTVGVFEVKMIYPECIKGDTIQMTKEDLLVIAQNCDLSMISDRVLLDRLPEIIINISDRLLWVECWVKAQTNLMR